MDEKVSWIYIGMLHGSETGGQEFLMQSKQMYM